MKLYCARIEEVEHLSQDNTYTNIVYIGDSLDMAVERCSSYVCVGTLYEVESKTIDVWEDGEWLITLDGNGEEFDYEN